MGNGDEVREFFEDRVDGRLSSADLIDGIKAIGGAGVDVTSSDAIIKQLETKIVEYGRALTAAMEPATRSLYLEMKRDSEEHLVRIKSLREGEEEMAAIRQRVEHSKKKARINNYLFGVMVFASGMFLIYLFAHI